MAQGNWLESQRDGFQEYAIATAVYAARVPASFALDAAAASLSLGLIPAATGFNQKGELGVGQRVPWEVAGADTIRVRRFSSRAGRFPSGAMVCTLLLAAHSRLLC